MKYKLPKSLRDKKRYIKFHIDSDSRFSREEVRRAFWDMMLSFLGEKGSSKVNFKVSDWQEEGNIGIVRCSIDSVDDMIVCMKFIRDIQGNATNMLVKGISGTLKSLEKC